MEHIRSHLFLPIKQNTLFKILYKARVSVYTLPVSESSLERQDLGCGHSTCKVEYPGTQILSTLYRPPEHVPDMHFRSIPETLTQRAAQSLCC
jgi:hypothetical protein